MTVRRRYSDDRPASWWSIITVAALPAVALASLWQAADAYVPPPTTTTTTTVAPEPVSQLVTALMSVRRHPTPIAHQGAAAEAKALLADEVAAFADLIGPNSCAVVVDPDDIAASGGVIASVRADAEVTPASNQKLFVAAAALDVLGPDYRFTTELRGAAPISGVIDGDVFLIGGGDPLLVTDPARAQQRYPAFNITPVAELASRLQSAGVSRITGQIVGDGSRYDDEWRAPSWGSDITTRDVAPTDGLLIDDGLLGDSGVAPNPNLAAADTFVDALRSVGIAVEGGATAGAAPDPAPPVLASIESAPLADIIAELLYTSDNTTAEMLVKELGVVGAGEGNRTKGLGVIAATLASWGLPIDTLSLQDGAGLSRNNVTSCETLAALIERAPIAEHLVALLPVAGRDGTLSAQLDGTPADGSMRAKTGTLTDVKALSGVQPGSDGEPVVFAVVLNEPSADDPTVFQPVWAGLADLIAEYPVDVDLDAELFAPR